MANCPNLVFWSPIPDGSTFKIKASGDADAFSITVGCSRNGGIKPILHHDDVVTNGPASQAIAAGDRWAFTPAISIFHTPANDVAVEAWVEGPDGKDVMLPTDEGSTFPAHCQWTFNAVGGQLLTILIAA